MPRNFLTIMSSVKWFEKEQIYFGKEGIFTIVGGALYNFLAVENVKIRNKY